MNIEIEDALVVPKNNIAFDVIAFVCGAICKDEERYVLHHMQVTKADLITRYAATDGRRLHLGEIDPGMFDDDIDVLDEGLYLILAKSAQFIVIQRAEKKLKFPEWKQIVGDYEPGDNLQEVHDVGDAGKIGEVMIRTQQLLDVTYLAQALGYGTSRKTKEPVSITFEATSKTGPVIMAHDHGTAFLMPMVRQEPDPDIAGAVETLGTDTLAALKNFSDSLNEDDSVTVEAGGESKTFTKGGDDE